MAANPIPEGYPRVMASLAVPGAADAIAFYAKVFGATERMRFEGPPGRIAHAEIQIGDSVVMVADEFPDIGFVGPKSMGGTPITMCVYVEDVDKTYATALEAGATEVRPVEDQFYGDRSGMFDDPWGYRWSVSTHIEDVSEEEMTNRMEAMGG